MAQGMKFNWRNSREKMLADEAELAQLDYDTQKAHEMEQLIEANANATRAYKLMELGDQLNSSEAMADVQKTLLGQKEMEAQQEEAERQRWMELEKQQAERKARIQNDPRMQMAAMLAMGGQPSALSSMLVSSVQGDIQAKQKASEAKDRADKEMEALEKGLQNDLMYLASMNKDQHKKVLEVSLPMFRSKFKELEALGARSLMGGLDAWERRFKGFLSVGKGKYDEAKRKHDRDSNLRFVNNG